MADGELHVGVGGGEGGGVGVGEGEGVLAGGEEGGGEGDCDDVVFGVLDTAAVAGGAGFGQGDGVEGLAVEVDLELGEVGLQGLGGGDGDGEGGGAGWDCIGAVKRTFHSGVLLNHVQWAWDQSRLSTDEPMVKVTSSGNCCW